MANQLSEEKRLSLHQMLGRPGQVSIGGIAPPGAPSSGFNPFGADVESEQQIQMRLAQEALAAEEARRQAALIRAESVVGQPGSDVRLAPSIVPPDPGLAGEPATPATPQAQAVGAGVGISPASRQLSTIGRTQRQEQALLSKRMKATEELSEAQMKVLESERDLQLERQADVDELREASARQDEADLLVEMDKQAEERAANEDAREGFRKAVDTASQMRIDPYRSYHNADTGTKIRIGISLALGALAQSLKGGRNVGLDMFNKAIDADIMAQESAIQTARGVVSDKLRYYQEIRLDSSTDQEARIKLKMAHTQNFKQQLQMAAQQNQSAEIQNNFMRSMNEVEAQEGDLMSQLEGEIIRSRHQRKTEQNVIRQEQAKQAAKARGKKELGVNKFGDFDIAGTVQTASVPAPIKKQVATIMGDFSGMDGLFEDAIKMRSKEGVQFLPSEKKAQANQIHAQLAIAVRKFANTGVHVGPKEQQNVDDIIGESLTGAGFTLSKLKAARRTMRKKTAAAILARGHRLSAAMEGFSQKEMSAEVAKQKLALMAPR